MFQCSKLPCLGWRSADFLQGFFHPKCLQDLCQHTCSRSKISMAHELGLVKFKHEICFPLHDRKIEICRFLTILNLGVHISYYFPLERSVCTVQLWTRDLRTNKTTKCVNTFKKEKCTQTRTECT
jgi:hypothetical protein